MSHTTTEDFRRSYESHLRQLSWACDRALSRHERAEPDETDVEAEFMAECRKVDELAGYYEDMRERS